MTSLRNGWLWPLRDHSAPVLYRVDLSPTGHHVPLLLQEWQREDDFCWGEQSQIIDLCTRQVCHTFSSHVMEYTWWSSDGRYLAYFEQKAAGSELALFDIASLASTCIAHLLKPHDHLSISGTGQPAYLISCPHWCGSRKQWHIYNEKGQNLLVCAAVHVSDDGSKLAVRHAEPEEWTILTVEVMGLRMLCTLKLACPCWQVQSAVGLRMLFLCAHISLLVLLNLSLSSLAVGLVLCYWQWTLMDISLRQSGRQMPAFWLFSPSIASTLLHLLTLLVSEK